MQRTTLVNGVQTVSTYMDYNSTTPVDERVLKAMLPFYTEHFGNPSSSHMFGAAAAEVVEVSRRKVAESIGMRAADIIFTSGATEANNLALTGLRVGMHRNIKMLAGATEHKSVLQTCKSLADGGSTYDLVPVLPNGMIDLEVLDDMMSNDVDIVSIMAANSETGVIHPMREAADIIHDYGALLHCDATQAIGKIPFNGSEIGADMITLSGHKLYGPKGCGALAATRSARRRISHIIHGGGQENEMRSGTLNVPAIVGFGDACMIATTDGLVDAPRQRRIRDKFERHMSESIPDISVNGYGAERLPNTSNVWIRGALADAIMSRLRTICISTGSACSSNTIEPSHILIAMGLDRAAADESIRVSIGRDTTTHDMDNAVQEMIEAVKAIRAIDAGSTYNGH